MDSWILPSIPATGFSWYHWESTGKAPATPPGSLRTLRHPKTHPRAENTPKTPQNHPQTTQNHPKTPLNHPKTPPPAQRAPPIPPPPSPALGFGWNLAPKEAKSFQNGPKKAIFTPKRDFCCEKGAFWGGFWGGKGQNQVKLEAKMGPKGPFEPFCPFLLLPPDYLGSNSGFGGSSPLKSLKIPIFPLFPSTPL